MSRIVNRNRKKKFQTRYQLQEIRKVILIIVIMAAAYFVITFVASLIECSSNLAKSAG
ncbi:MAG TPA: hypothetical protein VHH33_02970 [Nitrososphaeraceae archaeon]|nr:hypothetical protein [Nitrososphaeraceae archaeon]